MICKNFILTCKLKNKTFLEIVFFREIMLPPAHAKMDSFSFQFNLLDHKKGLEREIERLRQREREREKRETKRKRESEKREREEREREERERREREERGERERREREERERRERDNIYLEKNTFVYSRVSQTG
jgi:hypothetical protein